MNDPLAPLRAKFRIRAANDLARLRVLAADDPKSDELRTLVHNMAGAAGTFGYADLSEAAKDVDDRYFAGEAPEPGELALLELRLAEAAQAG